MVDFKKMLEESNSDKESNVHAYGDYYNEVINKYKEGEATLLEVGISKGDSIRVWAESGFFKTVVGVDRRNKMTQENVDALKDKADLYFRDAYTVSTLNVLGEKYGGFDIIIDDGSHRPGHQLFFMAQYNALLNEGGILICEDVRPKTIKVIEDQKLGYNVVDLNDKKTNRFHDSAIIWTKK